MWNLKDHEYFHFLTTERGCMQFKFQKKKKKKQEMGHIMIMCLASRTHYDSF